MTDTPLVQSGLDDPEVEQGIRAFPIPIGRFAEPSEIAAAIAFLLGPEASADKSLGIQSWRHMPHFNGMKIYKPIVFAVNGPVHWGGDAARQHARGLRRRGYFGLLELRWGIGQGGAAAAQMRWDLPWRIAMDMVLRGRRMDADEALRYGFINEIALPDELAGAAMREIASAVVADAAIDYAMNGRSSTRRGNRHPSMAPHGCYPCAGDDRWVTIAVRSDEEWRRFADAIGGPDWAGDRRFGTAPGRLAHQDELDARIADWTATRAPRAVMERLQQAGVPSGAVLNVADVLADPQIVARGAYSTVTHLELGEAPIRNLPGGSHAPQSRCGDRRRCSGSTTASCSSRCSACRPQRSTSATTPAS